jgi:hypothetical protein
MQVYSLQAELKDTPERMLLAQALTKNHAKPGMGLKGEYGLFGSEEWWRSIETGRMSTGVTRGRIVELFYAGMDNDRRPNAVKVETNDGPVEESMYFNTATGRDLYEVGKQVEFSYALDPLKVGGFSKVVFSVSIGEEVSS